MASPLGSALSNTGAGMARLMYEQRLRQVQAAQQAALRKQQNEQGVLRSLLGNSALIKDNPEMLVALAEKFGIPLDADTYNKRRTADQLAERNQGFAKAMAPFLAGLRGKIPPQLYAQISRRMGETVGIAPEDAAEMDWDTWAKTQDEHSEDAALQPQQDRATKMMSDPRPEVRLVGTGIMKSLQKRNPRLGILLPDEAPAVIGPRNTQTAMSLHGPERERADYQKFVDRAVAVVNKLEGYTPEQRGQLVHLMVKVKYPWFAGQPTVPAPRDPLNIEKTKAEIAEIGSVINKNNRWQPDSDRVPGPYAAVVGNIAEVRQIVDGDKYLLQVIDEYQTAYKKDPKVAMQILHERTLYATPQQRNVLVTLPKFTQHDINNERNRIMERYKDNNFLLDGLIAKQKGLDLLYNRTRPATPAPTTEPVERGTAPAVPTPSKPTTLPQVSTPKVPPARNLPGPTPVRTPKPTTEPGSTPDLMKRLPRSRKTSSLPPTSAFRVG